MSQILWFRRDLRISDSAILSNAKEKVLPIFIFDKNILNKLPFDDKRVSFLYQSVIKLKFELKKIALDLAIFYDEPINVFKKLKQKNYTEVLCSIDFDEYSRIRDREIEKIIPMKRFIDSFILDPSEHLKKDSTAYKVFTPFYKSLSIISESLNIEVLNRNKKLEKVKYEYDTFPTLDEIGFKAQILPIFLQKNVLTLLEEFKEKINDYELDRDFFYKDASSKLSVHLRFGLISPKEVFNYYKSLKNINSDFFIKELFWREFYNYILFHYPYSENKNFNHIKINWNENEEDFQNWCEGKTGVPLIDAAMRCLNNTGTMHNRLRMVVASFLCKNLFINWKKAEQYFALKLLDYEASSNIGSWQWSASTGADASPYFRVFNPYLQSKKFDKEGIFIKSILSELKNVDAKLFHIENSLVSDLFVTYPKSIVDISSSRKQAIEKFKRAKNENI